MEREATLWEVLEAREARALRQRALLEEYGLPLVSFTMNIAGPVKNGPLVRRAFRTGLDRLSDALRTARAEVPRREERDGAAGCEALLAVRGDPGEVKALCVELEDEDALGRLFDMDVLSPGGEKLDREALGYPPRRCLICGKPGKGCASRRLHPVEALQAATGRILRDYFAGEDAGLIAAQAVRALLYEVCAAPKPGLVDRLGNGSHRDMDIFTFLDSTAALLPYFRQAVSIGQATALLPPEETFRRLRRAGLAAERAMFAATSGVNTHKGAIFSLGAVCAAAGRLWTPERPRAGIEAVLAECAAMSAGAAAGDFAAIRSGSADTAGARLFLRYGLRGIRGELADGLPGVRDTALPALRAALDGGASLEQAGTAALVRLMARLTDTNLIARGGPEGQAWAAHAAAELEGFIPGTEALEALDRAMRKRGLSPGGCADLLAITYFLHFYTGPDTRTAGEDRRC